MSSKNPVRKEGMGEVTSTISKHYVSPSKDLKHKLKLRGSVRLTIKI